MRTKTFTLTAMVLLTSHSYAQPHWSQIKNNTVPSVSLTSEYGTPYRLNHTNLAWEDSPNITRDGLTVYCLYLPIDVISWEAAGADPCTVAPYLRVPLLGVDLITNPVGCSEWAQGDIMYSKRTTLNDTFPTWKQSGLSAPVFSEVSLFVMQDSVNPGIHEVIAYANTDNPPAYTTDIRIAWNQSDTLTNPGAIMPSQINTDSTREDNPYIERISATHLVLFFDSDNRPGNIGDWDIWYSMSTDNGNLWSIPQNMTSINTSFFESHPHLFKDSIGIYWMYYTGTDSGTGKYQIYRSQQLIPGDWNSWGAKQLVIGVGNAVAVAEPSLTKWGDICFAVVYDGGTGFGTDSTDRFDNDLWILPKKGYPLVTEYEQKVTEHPMRIYPNPFSEQTTLYPENYF